ncbi:hypothetical protein ANN_11198, partial [Periplaneta americana]
IRTFNTKIIYRFLTEEKLDDVGYKLEQSPMKSLRKFNRQVDIGTAVRSTGLDMESGFALRGSESSSGWNGRCKLRYGAQKGRASKISYVTGKQVDKHLHFERILYRRTSPVIIHVLVRSAYLQCVHLSVADHVWVDADF